MPCGGDAPGAVQAPGDPGPLWLVINLERSPDRLAAITADLARLGLPFTRVAAVDGRLLSSPLPGVDPALCRASHGSDLLPGEVGCALSHLRALSVFLATDARHAVILEDDAIVTGEVATIVAALLESGAPDDWDLVKLEAHHRTGGLALRRLVPGFKLGAMPYRSAGSAAYLIDRAAASRLLADLLPMRFPYDVAFERGWDFGMRVRSVLPPPVRTAAVVSTLARDGRIDAKRRAPALPRAHAKAMYALTALSAWLVRGGRRHAPGSGHARRTPAAVAGADRPPARGRPRVR